MHFYIFHFYIRTPPHFHIFYIHVSQQHAVRTHKHADARVMARTVQCLLKRCVAVHFASPLALLCLRCCSFPVDVLLHGLRALRSLSLLLVLVLSLRRWLQLSGRVKLCLGVPRRSTGKYAEEVLAVGQDLATTRLRLCRFWCTAMLIICSLQDAAVQVMLPVLGAVAGDGVLLGGLQVLGGILSMAVCAGCSCWLLALEEFREAVLNSAELLSLLDGRHVSDPVSLLCSLTTLAFPRSWEGEAA